MIFQGTELSMVRGDSECFTVCMKDESGGLLPMEEGDVLYFTVKQNACKPAPDLQKAVREFPEGKAVVLLEPRDTKALLPGKYRYDIQLTRADGWVRTLIKPSGVVLEEEVTSE